MSECKRTGLASEEARVRILIYKPQNSNWGMAKEGEDSSDGYPVIKKYIREDSGENAETLKKEGLLRNYGKDCSRTSEVFGRVGEGEDCSEGNFHRKNKDDAGFEESPEKIKFTPGPRSEAKKEFFKQLEDEPLSIEMCENLMRDRKKNKFN